MIWNSASEFLAMGGYGLYVWGSYGVMALALGADALIAFKRRRDVAAAASAKTGENS